MKNKQVPLVVLWFLLAAVALGAGFFFMNLTKLSYTPPAVDITTSPKTQTATSSGTPVVKKPTITPVVTPVKSESTGTEVMSSTTVTGIVVSGNQTNIVVDYIDVLWGEERYRALIADGKCTQVEVNSGECDNPSGSPYDRNVNPKLRTLKMSSNPEIFSWTKEHVLLSSITAQYPYNYPVTITLDGKGEVSKIEQIFRP